MKQSTNQSINQSINQLINQLADGHFSVLALRALCLKFGGCFVSLLLKRQIVAKSLPVFRKGHYRARWKKLLKSPATSEPYAILEATHIMVITDMAGNVGQKDTTDHCVLVLAKHGIE